ncbi:hypothetical protein M407DRAFT_229233 [Tulasnella calospora MUT 4182]|uniref:Uncharacterized protein n=1 Tax=Tulasnella calospora MUT 4182 TaxID=1051891 RepID=A0A0C3QMA8_9AGAM|nr:hypothetical protein M407DRAFT_229233 [Tulasnella calospora MUT 4182]
MDWTLHRARVVLVVQLQKRIEFDGVMKPFFRFNVKWLTDIHGQLVIAALLPTGGRSARVGFSFSGTGGDIVFSHLACSVFPPFPGVLTDGHLPLLSIVIITAINVRRVQIELRDPQSVRVGKPSFALGEQYACCIVRRSGQRGGRRGDGGGVQRRETLAYWWTAAGGVEQRAAVGPVDRRPYRTETKAKDRRVKGSLSRSRENLFLLMDCLFGPGGEGAI